MQKRENGSVSRESPCRPDEHIFKEVRNVYYMNIDGTGRTKVADNARQPCWGPDGKTIAYTQFLAALDFMIGPGKEIVVAGDSDNAVTQEMLETIQKRFMPNKIMLLKHPGERGKRLVALSSFAEALTPLDNKPTVYVCEQYACKTPVTDIKELEKVLQ